MANCSLRRWGGVIRASELDSPPVYEQHLYGSRHQEDRDAERSRLQPGFFGWIMRNSELLRSGHLPKVDAAHIAGDLERMGGQDLRQWGVGCKC